MENEVNNGEVLSDELRHYGVLGMKWGVRRYQPYPKGKAGTFKGKTPKPATLRTANKDAKKARKTAFKDVRARSKVGEKTTIREAAKEIKKAHKDSRADSKQMNRNIKADKNVTKKEKKAAKVIVRNKREVGYINRRNSQAILDREYKSAKGAIDNYRNELKITGEKIDRDHLIELENNRVNADVARKNMKRLVLDPVNALDVNKVSTREIKEVYLKGMNDLNDLSMDDYRRVLHGHINNGEVLSDELRHYGVLGMKWGVRRYQPYPKGKAGTFKGKTPKPVTVRKGNQAAKAAGKTKAKDLKAKSKAGDKIAVRQASKEVKKTKQAAREAAKQTNRNIRADKKAARKAEKEKQKTLDPKKLSDAELKDAVARLNLEERYYKLTDGDMGIGESIVWGAMDFIGSEVVVPIIKEEARDVVRTAITEGVKVYKDVRRG